MTAEGAGTSISSLDAHFLKLRRYAELGSIRSLKVPLGEDVSSEVGLREFESTSLQRRVSCEPIRTGIANNRLP
jgi:hypothetical protein